MLASLPISSTQGLVPVSAVARLQRPLLSVSVVGAIFVARNVVLWRGAMKRRGSISIWRSWDSRCSRMASWFQAFMSSFVLLKVPVVLFRLHAGIRWGAILAILGAVHGIHHRLLGKGRG